MLLRYLAENPPFLKMSLHEGSPEPRPFSCWAGLSFWRTARLSGTECTDCGIGGEGETGAFKCLTLSTLSPAPDAGPFFESPLARHRATLIQIRRRRSSKHLAMIEDR